MTAQASPTCRRPLRSLSRLARRTSAIFLNKKDDGLPSTRYQSLLERCPAARARTLALSGGAQKLNRYRVLPAGRVGCTAAAGGGHVPRGPRQAQSRHTIGGTAALFINALVVNSKGAADSAADALWKRRGYIPLKADAIKARLGYRLDREEVADWVLTRALGISRYSRRSRRARSARASAIASA